MTGGERVHVDVLGPIRARDGRGQDLTPDGALQRRLLALLVLHRGQTVTADAAIDALWDDRAPRDPAAALQTHLFRLRRALPDGLIESTATGYSISPTRVVVDADQLAAAVTARAADAVGAVDAALARWRGPAYPELVDTDAGRVEAARLEDLRVAALERQAEARLEAGATDDLVADLAALADAHPLRERPRELLMTALAASGRTADALRAYDDFRRLLGDELGIEPSPALTALHGALLHGGPGGEWAPTHRLPATVTSLLGRAELLDETAGLVEAHRLVTLLGPGGVGKTRLAIELGHRLRAAHPERAVVLVELAAATADSAVDEVAAALGIDGRPGVGLGERLATVLADVEVVLLLDNCEHVLDPVAELVERLLAGCPQVTMVATSRERLRVAGEQLCAVPPLPHDGDDDTAARLFIDRARAVSPSFDPSARDQKRIDEIVRRLDGLPLAIELAAARLHTLDVSEVAAGLDRRFRLLSSGSRTSTRHGSLHAAVAWSVGLLDAELRRVFADLSVFASAFDVGAAAAICGLDRPDVAAALDQLAERSLVMRAPGRRYVLLETLREFGSELLDEEGRAPEAHGRHARYAIDRIETADRAVLDPGQEDIFFQIDSALPELRNALDWLLTTGDLEGAARIVVALYYYGFLRLRPDVLWWADRVAAADPDDRDHLAPEVWTMSAMAAWMSGDLRETARRAERATAIIERRGESGRTRVATMQGSLALFEGRLDEAAEHYEQARQLAWDDPPQRITAQGSRILALAYSGDPRARTEADALVAEVDGQLGPHAAYAWYCAGEAELNSDVDLARERHTRAIEIADATGTSFVSGVAGTSRASIEARVGDPARAADEFRLLVAHWRRAGMWATQWTMLRSIAVLLERLGRHEASAVLASAVLATQAGNRVFGDDAVALTELADRLRATLGEAAFEAAAERGRVLDGPEAVEHALQSL